MPIDATAKFSDVYRSFERQDLSNNKHLRMQDGKGLYVHSGFSLPKLFDLYGKHAARRAEKQANAGQGVWQSIANQHGKEVADRIFRNVLRSDRADHKVAVTWGDMQRIKRAIPQAIRASELAPAVQDAAELYARNNPTTDHLQQFFGKHLDAFSSPEFYRTKNFKFGEEQFRLSMALAHFDRMNDPEVGQNRHDREWLRTALDLPDDDRPPMPSPDSPKDEFKSWMADKLHQQFFAPGSKHSINFNNGRRQRAFDQRFQTLQTADEKLDALRNMYNSLTLSGDVREIAQRAQRSLMEMQDPSISRNSLIEQADAHLDDERHHGTGRLRKQMAAQHLQRLQIGVRNRQVVRKFLPGTARFNKLADQQDINPKHLLHQERKYISDRLQMLAAQRARSGEVVDGNWARAEVSKALKELETHGPGLAAAHQQAAAAAHSVMRGLLSPGSMPPDELAAKTMEFVFRCKDYQQQAGRMGNDAFLEDVNNFLQMALRATSQSPHADPIKAATPLLYASHLAAADHSVNTFSEFSGYMESGIEHHTNDLARVLQEAIGQIADQTQTPELNAQFRQLSNTAYQTVDQVVEAERSRGDRKFDVNRKVPLPGGAAKGVGASNDDLYAAAGTILKLASEREESQKDASARKDSSADYDPNDLNDENVHVNANYQS